MTDETIIRVENLTKNFNIYKKPFDLLYELITRKQRHDIFTALSNVSFELKKGDRVGIVGANGAGKSTLLKIITGNLSHTSGKVEVNGKISSMLSLTSFLDENETGLQNIKYNLQIMGVPAKKIVELTDEIIEFIELGQFIHAPVKTYSSGMNARLAFAISTAFSPEILVVDEILGAGDGYFIGKAVNRMKDLCERGRALLYVSHSLSALQMLCNKAIWLDKGVVRMIGAVDEVLKHYESDYRIREDMATREGNRKKLQQELKGVIPADFEDRDVRRFRIIPASKEIYHDTYYVEKIAVMSGDKTYELLLSEDENLDSEFPLSADILNSEWGSIYQKDGCNTRLLNASTGKRFGGHFLINCGLKFKFEGDIQVSFIYTSGSDTEQLVLEMLDIEKAKWVSVDFIDNEFLRSNNKLWRKNNYHCHFKKIDKELADSNKLISRRNNSPNIVITSVELQVDGQSTNIFKERQPFKIIIEAEVIKDTKKTDFGLRIIRNDGVYMYWQSTGFSDRNVTCNEGEIVRIEFDFSNNYFPAGCYGVTVSVANGWDLENNYPYSEVYERRINCLKFTVFAEYKQLDFGAINQRVPTKIVMHKRDYKKHHNNYSNV